MKKTLFVLQTTGGHLTTYGIDRARADQALANFKRAGVEKDVTLVIAHNMNTRQAHPPFVEAITTNPKLETLFLHMDAAGVAVTMKKR